ncbi:MAG: hypothetical protein WBA24_00035, partial [Geitlerinemataceae cyanobacterium]
LITSVDPIRFTEVDVNRSPRSINWRINWRSIRIGGGRLYGAKTFNRFAICEIFLKKLIF